MSFAANAPDRSRSSEPHPSPSYISDAQRCQPHPHLHIHRPPKFTYPQTTHPSFYHPCLDQLPSISPTQPKILSPNASTSTPSPAPFHAFPPTHRYEHATSSPRSPIAHTSLIVSRADPCQNPLPTLASRETGMRHHSMKSLTREVSSRWLGPGVK